jgi:hypothetical protein
MAYQPKRKRFLTLDEIERTIDFIDTITSKTNIRVALAGGVAAQLYGSDRLTADVDVVSSRVPPNFVAVKQLSFGGVQGKTPEGVEVDFIVRSDDYKKLYKEGLERAIAVEDIPFPVIRPDYLMAFKLVAARPKDEIDLKAMLKANSASTAEKARSIIKRLLGQFAAEEFDSFRMEAEWEAERERRKK